MCFSRFEFSHIAATCFFAQPPAPRKLLQRNFQFSELFVLARPLENVTSGPLLFPNPPVVLGKPSSALACINIIFGDTQKAYLYRHRFSVIHLPTWWPANVLRKRTRNNRRHSCQGKPKRAAIQQIDSWIPFNITQWRQVFRFVFCPGQMRKGDRKIYNLQTVAPGKAFFFFIGQIIHGHSDGAALISRLMDRHTHTYRNKKVDTSGRYGCAFGQPLFPNPKGILYTCSIPFFVRIIYIQLLDTR